MSDDALPYLVRAGRNGSREYLAPNWQPGDPPFYVIPREPVRDRLAPIRKNGQPRALTDKQALQIIALAHTWKDRHLHPGSDHVNVNELAQEIAIEIFGKGSDIKRNENVRQLIRRLGLAK